MVPAGFFVQAERVRSSHPFRGDVGIAVPHDVLQLGEDGGVLVDAIERIESSERHFYLWDRDVDVECV